MPFGSGVFPATWQIAIIMPVSKCALFKGVAELILISVTPLMLRLVERLVVKHHIFQQYHLIIYDQFGFKLTSDTTAALVNLTNSLSIMLEENKYDHCLLINILKAFDSINHLILIKKNTLLNLQDNIIYWVVSLLIDREQFTKIDVQRSAT